MNKGTKGRILHRVSGQRKHLVRSLASSLFIHEQIISSEAKLKFAIPTIEKWITRAKRNTLSDRRFLYAHLEKQAAERLITLIAPRMMNRKGGYTRMLSVGRISQDATKKASLELTDREVIEKKKKKEATAKKAPKKKTTKKTVKAASTKKSTS